MGEKRSRVVFFSKRLAVTYVAYLILLGPFWSAYGRGWLPLPRSFGNAVFLPVYPLISFKLSRCVYEEYLDMWYNDPNSYESTD